LQEKAMNVLVVALFSILIPLTGVGLHVLQESLEDWDHRRHAND
jgi:hypothetical protein